MRNFKTSKLALQAAMQHYRCAKKKGYFREAKGNESGNNYLFSPNGQHEFAGSAVVSVFAQVNALPGAEQQFPIPDGN